MRRAVLGLSIALAAALLLSGCGGSASERAVRGAEQDYISALYGYRPARVCARLAPAMEAALLDELPSSVAAGKPCTARLAAAFAAATHPPTPKFSIEHVHVHGGAASVTVEARGLPTHSELVRSRSGRWLVSCCAGAQIDRLASVTRRVTSASMAPTFKSGTVFTADQRAYRASPPRIGDVVVFHAPRDPSRCPADEGPDSDRLCSRVATDFGPQVFLKRVVAGPGDRVALRGGHLVRNGKPVTEPFIRACEAQSGCDLSVAILVPPGTYYLLGDNRGASDDSRFFGPIPRAQIVGRVKVG